MNSWLGKPALDLAEPERKLAAGMPRCVPDLQFQAPDIDLVAVLHQPLDLHGRHFQVNILRRDFGVRHELVTRFERNGRGRMASDRRLEQLLIDLGEPIEGPEAMD